MKLVGGGGNNAGPMAECFQQTTQTDMNIFTPPLPIQNERTLFLYEVHKPSNSVIYLAPIIFDAKSLDE